MRRHLRIFRLLLLILILLIPLSSGCWNRLETNEVVIVTGMGYDLTPDNKTKVSVQVVTPQSTGSGEGGGDGKKPILSYAATDRFAAKAARDLTLTVPRLMLWAHASAYVFGDEMARRGMPAINDFLDRNRNIRKSGFIMVAKDSEAELIMQAESPVSPKPVFDIVAMLKLQDNQAGIYTPVQLSEYLLAISTPGIDPILPAVELEKGKQLRLSGMAVFHEDRMIDYLNERESRGYRWLRHKKVEGGMLTISSPVNDKPVLLEVLRSTNSITTAIKGNEIIYKIEIQMEGNFYEQNDSSELLTTPLIKSMESRAATQIENEARAYLNKSQQLNCDCVGFGRKLAQQKPDIWDQISSQWSEIYPEVKFEFDVRAKIRRTGLTNKAIQISF